MGEQAERRRPRTIIWSPAGGPLVRGLIRRVYRGVDETKGGPTMMDGWDGIGVAGWFLMTVFWVALLAAVVWAIANLFPGRISGEPAPDARSERPAGILD